MRELLSAVLAVFQRVVQGWYRRQAKAQGHPGGRCGAVTFVQRFGSSINLNPHLHVLMLDGVYVGGEGGDGSTPSIRKVLDALGLPSRAPPVARARFQQLGLDAA
jgi:hypothetical protein